MVPLNGLDSLRSASLHAVQELGNPLNALQPACRRTWRLCAGMPLTGTCL